MYIQNQATSTDPRHRAAHVRAVLEQDRELLRSKVRAERELEEEYEWLKREFGHAASKRSHDRVRVQQLSARMKEVEECLRDLPANRRSLAVLEQVTIPRFNRRASAEYRIAP
jgi:hypothetical protein